MRKTVRGWTVVAAVALAWSVIGHPDLTATGAVRWFRPMTIRDGSTTNLPTSEVSSHPGCQSIEAPPDHEVVLRFTRKVADTCADAVIVQGDPVKHMLPQDKPVEVRLTAPKTGQIRFACPMDMYSGAIVVTGG